MAAVASGRELARAYKPYIETCVVAFGPDRGMFESNFPPDSVSSSYAVLWNTLKRLAARGGGCRSLRRRRSCERAIAGKGSRLNLSSRL